MTRGWEIYELTDEADDGYYSKLFDALSPAEYKEKKGIPVETQESVERRQPLFARIEISEKYDVVRVYVDGEMVGIEMEDRFPSKELVGKVRLMLL